MEANEGSHEGMEYEEESAPRAIEAEQYTYTEKEAGTLLITGPDVTGLEHFPIHYKAKREKISSVNEKGVSLSSRAESALTVAIRKCWGQWR